MKFFHILLLFGSLLFFTACQSSGEQNSTASTPTAPATPQKSAPAEAPNGLRAQSFRGLQVQPFNFPGRTFMGIRDQVPFAKIQPFYAQNLGKVMTACQAYGLQMDGMPSGLFYEFNEEKGYADMAATISVVSGKPLGDGIQMINLAAGKALKIDYYGNYVGIADAHYAMEDYLKANKITQNKAIPIIEEYITDPGAEPDPNKRLTRVTYFYN